MIENNKIYLVTMKKTAYKDPKVLEFKFSSIFKQNKNKNKKVQLTWSRKDRFQCYSVNFLYTLYFIQIKLHKWIVVSESPRFELHEVTHSNVILGISWASDTPQKSVSGGNGHQLLNLLHGHPVKPIMTQSTNIWLL